VDTRVVMFSETSSVDKSVGEGRASDIGMIGGVDSGVGSIEDKGEVHMLSLGVDSNRGSE
jgi:hypothetical protein